MRELREPIPEPRPAGARALAVLLALIGLLVLAGVATDGTSRADAVVVPFVLGGTDAPRGSLPFAAFVQATVGSTTYSCTGTVVAPMVVLTAEHCTTDETGQPIPAGDFLVATGTTTLSPLDPGAEVHGVTVVHAYPEAALLAGDVATLVLDAPTAAPAVTLAKPADTALYAAGTTVRLAGWGQTSTDGPAANTLQQGDQLVRANGSCLQHSPGFDVRTQLCASTDSLRPAACHGDSGGPLLASTPAGWVEVGVVSYGPGACGTDVDYYARVSSLEGWIRSTIDGTPPPPPFQPPYVPSPSASVSLLGDTAQVAVAPPAPDPATIATNYSVTLGTADGRTLDQRAVPSDTGGPPAPATVAFPDVLAPGTYVATVSVRYTDGQSAPLVSAPVALAAPVATVPPTVTGPFRRGARLSCRNGSWSWAGPATFSTAWLRDGQPTPDTTDVYPLTRAEVGARISCRVTLLTRSGATAAGLSPAYEILPALAARTRPRVVGAARPGGRIACWPGTWRHPGRLRLSVRWLRDGRPAGRGLGLAIRAVDVGHHLSCRVTATAAGERLTRASRSVRVRP